MSFQFVDLFDHKKYGFNFLAIVFLFLGSLVAWVLAYGWQLAIDAILGEKIYMTWADALQMIVEFAVFAGVIVGCLHILKNDFLFPVAIGFFAVLWQVMSWLAGLAVQPQLTAVLLSFANPVLVFGGVVLAYRLLDNKLGAIILGYVAGGLLANSVSMLVMNGTELPVEVYFQTAAARMFLGFVIAVFLFTGIAQHLKNQEVEFDEFGFSTRGSSDIAKSDESPQGEIRSPLTMMLLSAVTLNIYMVGWIYRIYTEVRLREPRATTITAGKAIGFLFIPLFNLYWVVRLFIDLPRSIEVMQKEHPPSGEIPNRWLITLLLIASIVVACIGAGFEQTRVVLALNPLFLWWGMLLAQSSLNSHWRLRR